MSEEISDGEGFDGDGMENDEESDWLPTALVVAGLGALCCLGLPIVGGAAVTGGVAVGGLAGNLVAGLATAVTLGVVLLGARFWMRRG